MPVDSCALDFSRQVPDPIWGSIPITKFEEELLDAWSVARLGHIKQMGFAFLDFPSLTHTRLEHSLGVLYVADRLFEFLLESFEFPPSSKEASDLQKNSFTKETRQALRAAALLHDVGHPPFSHALELAFKRYPRLVELARDGLNSLSSLERSELGPYFSSTYSHENFTQTSLLHNKELLPILERKFPSRFVKQIADLATGKACDELAPFNGVISGDFDADRIDYLIRDNHHSGFVIGLSLGDLQDAVFLMKTGASSFGLCVRKRALPFVNTVLAARERLIREVHLARAGRAATQMVCNFLYETLIAIGQKNPGDLTRTLVELHSACTDYTFYQRATRDLQNRPEWKSVDQLMKRPGRKRVWPEIAKLDFMKMDPRLRLLSYLAADSTFEAPSALEMELDGRRIFVEPSTRPAPKFSLRVDFDDGKTETPSLDYIGSTENEQGRAILIHSVKNVDFFVYQMPTKESEPIAEAGERQSPAGCDPIDEALPRLVEEIAKRAQIRRDEKGECHSAEFILCILQALEGCVTENWPGDSSRPYVFRPEGFITKFLPSLEPDVSVFPKRLKANDDSSLAHSRAFAEIQRLRAFGLVESRQRTFYSGDAVKDRGIAGRSRLGVYSTREDFRLSEWGRHYVRSEISSGLSTAVREVVSSRQRAVCSALADLCELYQGGEIQPNQERIESRHILAMDLSDRIYNKKACALLFVRFGKDGGCEPPGTWVTG